MKHDWNDALAAYDRELPLLRALRDEYLAYIRERVGHARAALGADLAERVKLDAATPDDDDAGAELVPTGDGGSTGLQVQFWSSADVGDDPASYVWAMLLPRTLAPEFGEPRVALRVARQAANAVATEALEAAPAHVASFADFDIVRWGRIDLADPSFGADLARTVRAAATALVAASDAVLALRGTSPAGWAAMVLRDLRAENAFDGSTDTRSGQWKVGPLVSARVSASDYCWFTASGDGRLGLHWESKESAVARRELVPVALGGRPNWKERWDGVVLIAANELATLHHAGDAAALRNRVLAAWRAYRDACLTSSP